MIDIIEIIYKINNYENIENRKLKIIYFYLMELIS